MSDLGVMDALASACGVEPIKTVGLLDGSREGTLGDWKTLPASRITRVIRLRRQVLAFLRELPEHATVAELRDALEEG